MENTVHVLHAFLRQLKIRIDQAALRRIFDRHPMPHSIRALSDTLDELKVTNMVCRITPAQLSQIPIPVILFLKESKNLFYIFRGIDEHQNVTLQSSAKIRTLKLDDLCAVWDGVVLLAEKDEHQAPMSLWKYTVRRTVSIVSNHSAWWICGLSALIITWCLFFNPSSNVNTASQIAIYLLHLYGLCVSTIILAKTYWNPALLQQVCMTKHTDRCDEVFRSSGSLLFGWLSLGEVSWAYFFSLIVWGLFLTSAPLAVWLLCSTLSLAFVLYSLWWQWAKSKFCLWCTVLDAILAAEMLLLSFDPQARWSAVHFYPDLLLFSLCFLLVLLSVNVICALFKAKAQNIDLIKKREQLLSTPHILPSLLSAQPVVLPPGLLGVRTVTNAFPTPIIILWRF